MDKGSFWKTSGSYMVNPPLTKKHLDLAEGALGVRLPPEYVELLEVQNGGPTAGFAFPMSIPTTWASDHVPCNELAGIATGPDLPSHHHILESSAMSREWGLPPQQVLLAGDGHWWISLDYRESQTPCVTWLDCEEGQDIRIASSFGEFLAELVPASEFDEDTSSSPVTQNQWDTSRLECLIEEFPPRSQGQCLRLNQQLSPGETGWTMTRLQLPRTWLVSELAFQGVALVVRLDDGQEFRVHSANQGALQSALLSCSRDDSDALEQAWRNHASGRPDR